MVATTKATYLPLRVLPVFRRQNAPPESEPKPVQAVFQQQPLPEPAAAMLRQAGKMDKRQEALLLALKPFLRKERQEKIDRALHAARLASLASLALKNRGRGPGAKETP